MRNLRIRFTTYFFARPSGGLRLFLKKTHRISQRSELITHQKQIEKHSEIITQLINQLS